MINLLFQIFIAGLAILIVAIIINILANIIGIETWYGFINRIQRDGFLNSIMEVRYHLIFLLIIYPFVLGLVAHYFFKITNRQ